MIEEVVGDANALWFKGAVQMLHVIFLWDGETRRVVRTVSSQHLHGQCCIFYRGGKGTDLVKRGSECDKSIPRDAAVCGFKSDDATERGGLSNGSSRVAP